MAPLWSVYAMLKINQFSNFNWCSWDSNGWNHIPAHQLRNNNGMKETGDKEMSNPLKSQWTLHKWQNSSVPGTQTKEKTRENESESAVETKQTAKLAISFHRGTSPTSFMVLAEETLSHNKQFSFFFFLVLSLSLSLTHSLCFVSYETESSSTVSR
jgi:hypothetical protein